MNVLGDLGIIFNTTLMYATPLIFAAMGSMFCEKAGVVNVGIEGMMTVGAFAGATATLWSHNPWIGLLMAGVFGMLFALLHGIACLNFHADQTISGVAINFLAAGVTVFACKLFFDGSTMTPPIELDEKIPRFFAGVFETGSFSDNVFSTYATVYISFIVVLIAWFVLYKMRFGLRVRSVGENPAAADTLGIDVYWVRMIAVLLSGFLSGLGGASITLATVSAFRPTVIAGQGFIAIAAVIFGKYKPKMTMFACLLFGLCNGVAAYLGNPRVGVPIAEQLLSLLPYAITLILLLFMGRSVAPGASGKPYKKAG